MIIRNVKSDDYDEILKLQLELEDVEVNFDNNLKRHCYNTKKGQEKLKKRILNKKSIFYIAEENGEIVGFIDGYIADDEWWYEEQIAYLDHFIVKSEYRNKGIGTILLNSFEEKIKEYGITKIKLLVFQGNSNAIKFYKSNSYEDYSIYLKKEL